MRILGAVFFFVAAVWGTTASADHMTGRYQGTGDIGGVILDLRQSGTTLQGTISGADQGTLEGQTDGANNAQGTIQLSQPGSSPIQFQALWSQAGLAMRLQFPDGTRDVVFGLATAAAPPQPAPPPQPPPAGPSAPPPLPGQADVQYFVAVDGQQVGPLTLDDLITAIQKKQLLPADLVWKTGAPDWARADSYPELLAIFNAPPPAPPPVNGPPPLPPAGGGGGGPSTPGEGGGLTPPSG